MTESPRPKPPPPPEPVAGVPLPGRRAKCALCQSQIVFARTMPSDRTRKPGGKAMPLDPLTNLEGRVAVRDTGHGRLVCRVLSKDESHDHFTEVLAMPHWATCAGSGRNIAKDAEAFLADQGGASR